MSPRAKNYDHGMRARNVGVIATLTDGDRVVSFVSPGVRRKDALLAVAAECDRLGMWVQALSTPESILRDLQGSRPPGNAEPQLLGTIGRVDLSPYLPRHHGLRVGMTKPRRKNAA